MVVRRRYNPRKFIMELNGSYIIIMSCKIEQAFFSCIVPDFNFAVITSRNKERLGIVEMNGTNRA
jgi:hypothetical protein